MMFYHESCALYAFLCLSEWYISKTEQEYVSTTDVAVVLAYAACLISLGGLYANKVGLKNAFNLIKYGFLIRFLIVI